MLRRLLIEDEAAAAGLDPELAPELALRRVASRRAVIMGCEGESLEQLLLMLDVMGWATEAVDSSAGLLDALTAPRGEAFAGANDAGARDQCAELGPDLLFIDADQIAKAGFAINQSKTVVFLGRAPTHGRALFAGKTIIWLDIPLDIVKLERIIVNAA